MYLKWHLLFCPECYEDDAYTYRCLDLSVMIPLPPLFEFNDHEKTYMHYHLR